MQAENRDRVKLIFRHLVTLRSRQTRGKRLNWMNLGH